MGGERDGSAVANQTVWILVDCPNLTLSRPRAVPLRVLEARVVAVYEIAPQCIHNHEYHTLKRRFSMIVLQSRQAW